MWIKVVSVAAVAIIVLVVAIATRPAAFRVERSVTIAAPASVVFAHIADFRQWTAWSPYEKLDPLAQKSYSGPASGAGASFHYAGEKLGEGRMTVLDATPDDHITIRAEFLKPFRATNRIDFTLAPAPSGVRVTWAMSGTNSFVFKAVTAVVNMDKLLGKEFESGLADLKRVSEQDASRSLAATR